MPCEKCNQSYLDSYQVAIDQLVETEPQLTPHEARLTVARQFRPIFRAMQTAERVEKSGKATYENGEFILVDGRIYYPATGQFADQLHENQLHLSRLANDPEKYSLSDHQTTLLVEQALAAGATTVATVYGRAGEDNRDVLEYKYDPLSKKGRIVVHNQTHASGNLHFFDGIKEIAKAKFANLNFVEAKKDVFVLTDTRLAATAPRVVRDAGSQPMIVNNRQVVMKDPARSIKSPESKVSQPLSTSADRGVDPEIRDALRQRQLAIRLPTQTQLNRQKLSPPDRQIILPIRQLVRHERPGEVGRFAAEIKRPSRRREPERVEVSEKILIRPDKKTTGAAAPKPEQRIYRAYNKKIDRDHRAARKQRQVVESQVALGVIPVTLRLLQKRSAPEIVIPEKVTGRKKRRKEKLAGLRRRLRWLRSDGRGKVDHPASKTVSVIRPEVGQLVSRRQSKLSLRDALIRPLALSVAKKDKQKFSQLKRLPIKLVKGEIFNHPRKIKRSKVTSSEIRRKLIFIKNLREQISAPKTKMRKIPKFEFMSRDLSNASVMRQISRLARKFQKLQPKVDLIWPQKRQKQPEVSPVKQTSGQFELHLAGNRSQEVKTTFVNQHDMQFARSHPKTVEISEQITDKTIAFSLAWGLYLLLLPREEEKSTPEGFINKSTAPNEEKRNEEAKATPWIILTIIWYLAMVREQGLVQATNSQFQSNKIQKPKTKKRKSGQKAVAQPIFGGPFEAAGVIFAYNRDMMNL